MSIYIIGDVQGCFDELMSLLQFIEHDPKNDVLLFAGDLVNRGPKSLEVLRFIKNTPNTMSVLGNHDLTLLALRFTKHQIKQHTLHEVLAAPDCDDLIEWLRHQPLAHYLEEFNTLLVHAGVPPEWNLTTTLSAAKEVEKAIQGNHFVTFLDAMYGNEPSKWDAALEGLPRLRFITNALTRIRFCDRDGKIDFTYKGPLGSQPENLFPWFELRDRSDASLKIVFGHWAALQGQRVGKDIFPIDTGCVWGRSLTAMRLEDQKLFSVSCLNLRSNTTKE